MALTKQQLRRIEYLVNDEWDDDDDAVARRNFSKVLRQMTDAEELHQLAGNLNFDCLAWEMRAVIRHPLCDQGTALLVYWLGSPGWYCQYASRSKVPADEREVYNLLKEIERKYLAGGFKSQGIRFDPKKYKGENLLKQYEKQGGLRLVPEELKRPTSGKRIAIRYIG